MSQFTAIIADDEEHLIVYLRSRLNTLWPALDIVGEAKNGREALLLVEELQPDVAFLDIKMPVLSGIEVAARISNQCKIVFVTAFDGYAIEAFEQQAIDYLLKPVEDERLTKTIARLQQDESPNLDQNRLTVLLQQLTQKPEYLSWVRVGLRDETRIVSTEDIAYFQADQKYVTVQTREGEHLIRRSIKDLESELDPGQFWRIHRSSIVNVRFVELARKDFRGRYTLHLKGIPHTLKVSDRYSFRFRQM